MRERADFGVKGFTLVEVLAIVAIVALLFAITIPSLASARRRAKATGCLVNIRSVGQVLTVYASDQQDRFPHYAKPGAGNIYWVSQWTPLRFLDAVIWYTIPLRPWLDDAKAHPATVCPLDPRATAYREGGGWTSYEAAPSGYALATGVYTIPRLWQPPGGDPRDPSFYQVQQWASIALPSRKGILYEIRPWHDGYRPNLGTPQQPPDIPERLHSMLFGDLSAREARMTDLKPGLPLPGYTSSAPVATTVNGILGSDLP